MVLAFSLYWFHNQKPSEIAETIDGQVGCNKHYVVTRACRDDCFKCVDKLYLIEMHTWVYYYSERNDHCGYIVCDEITRTIEVWVWISNFTPHFIGHVFIYLWWDLS